MSAFLPAALLPDALGPLAFAAIFAVVVVAAVIRAFTGFGFALLAIPVLVLILPPAQVIPFIFLLELVISVTLLPRLWYEVDFSGLRWLLPGALLATPIGGYVLLIASAEALRLAIGLVVVMAALLMARGLRFRNRPGPAASFGTGLVSGTLNGAAGIPGPPVVLFYLATPAADSVSRATLIAYFTVTDIMGIGVAAWNGLFTWDTLLWALWLTPAMLIGSVLGQTAFSRVNPNLFRRIVLGVLLVTGLIGVAKAGFDLLQ